MLIFPFGSHSPQTQAIATLLTEILVLSAAVFVTALFAITIRTTACLSCSLLGAALTFGSPGLDPAYLHPRDSLGILPLIRDGWGLDPANDQQLAGLMWADGCFVYRSGILWTLRCWYGMPEYRAAEEPVR